MPLALKRAVGVLQSMITLFIFVWIIVGYVWLAETWIHDSKALEMRFKIFFLGVLIVFTLLYLPALIIGCIIGVKVIQHVILMSKQKMMERK